MAIYKPKELDFTKKKVKMLIYGVPSVGKTTLGLSAPKPLLIDLDKGISRIESRYRKDVLIAETFEELKNDLSGNDLSSYETLVIDTGGALLDLLTPFVIKLEPRNSTKSGDLSLAGWGALGREFRLFSEFVNGLGKHIIYIFHADERYDQDFATYRLSAGGQTRTKIWEDLDLGGFIEMMGKKRTLNFTANDRFFAKGNNQINGSYEIPILKEGVENNFLTLLIDDYIDKLAKTVEIDTKEQEAYDRSMKYADIINIASDADAINTAYDGLKGLSHALTSKRELWTILNKKANTLGLKFDSKTDSFVAEVKKEVKE